MQENKYIDWATRKEWVMIEGDSLPQPYLFEELVERINKDDKVYLESGVPKRFIREILEHSGRIFLVDNKKVKELRDKANIKKSDYADTIALKQYIDTNGKKFREITIDNFDLVELRSVYYLYEKQTQHVARLKNQQSNYVDEYGEESTDISKALGLNEKLKKEFQKSLAKYFKHEILLFNDIKGLGERYVFGVMLTANPIDFLSVTRYLMYCGLVSKGQIGNKYNRSAKSLFHQIAEGLIQHKDKEYYPLYLEIKTSIAERHNPEWTKGHINNVTINRIATLIAKEFYRRIRNEKHIQISLSSI
ncbi:hypothetical protein KAW18_02195 [candidate division WOR-3 bacterium]|nr:hypothetical protein [candidate division WOR-3 bacterium]